MTTGTLFAQDNARARSLALSLAAVPMLRLPDNDLLAQLTSPSFAEALATIGQAFSSKTMAEGLELLQGCSKTIAQLEPADRPALLAELGRDRTYLLRALAPDVGAPPAYESHWAAPGSTESVMLDLTQTYRRAGVELSGEAHERPDYLGVELLFLSELAARELEEGADAEALQAEQERFWATHVEPWATRYLREALPLAQTDLYRGTLTVALALTESGNRAVVQ